MPLALKLLAMYAAALSVHVEVDRADSQGGRWKTVAGLASNVAAPWNASSVAEHGPCGHAHDGEQHATCRARRRRFNASCSAWSESFSSCRRFTSSRASTSFAFARSLDCMALIRLRARLSASSRARSRSSSLAVAGSSCTGSGSRGRPRPGRGLHGVVVVASMVALYWHEQRVWELVGG